MASRSRGASPSSSFSIAGKRANLVGKGSKNNDDRLPARLAANATDQTDPLTLSMLRLADDEVERVWLSKTAVEKELRLSVVAKDAEIRQLRQALRASEATVENQQKTLEDLQHEFISLRAKADELDVSVVLKKLKMELLAKDNEVRQARAARDESTSHLTKALKTLEDTLTQREKLATELEAANRTIDFRIPELQSANESYLSDKEEIEQMLKVKLQEIDELRASEASLTAELTSVQLKLKNRTKLAFDQEVAASLTAVNAKVAAKTTELEKSNKTIKYLESELTTLKTENIAFFESEMTRLERKVAELTRMYEEEVARGVENGEKAKKTEAVQEEIRRAGEVFDKTVADFQSQIVDLKEQLERVKSENEALTEKSTRLSQYERIFESSELHSVLRTLTDVSGSSKKRKP